MSTKAAAPKFREAEIAVFHHAGKMTVTYEVEIPLDWVGYLTQNSDIFAGSRCGYWMFGVEWDAALGWLCFEHDDGAKFSTAEDVASEHPEFAAIEKAWRAGKELPAKWHRLNTESALRAYALGCKRWGATWHEQVDSTREDVVVQLALLGEVRYG